MAVSPSSSASSSSRSDDDFSQLLKNLIAVQKSIDIMDETHKEKAGFVLQMNTSDENEKMIRDDMEKRLKKMENHLKILQADMGVASVLADFIKNNSTDVNKEIIYDDVKQRLKKMNTHLVIVILDMAAINIFSKEEMEKNNSASEA